MYNFDPYNVFLTIATNMLQGHIYELSCDLDWSYDAENTASITKINYSPTHIHIENICFTF